MAPVRRHMQDKGADLQVKVLAMMVCVLFAMLIAVTSTILPVDDDKPSERTRPAPSVALAAVSDRSAVPSAQLAQHSLQGDPALGSAPPSPQRPPEASPAAGVPALSLPDPLPAEGLGASSEQVHPRDATVLQVRACAHAWECPSVRLESRPGERSVARTHARCCPMHAALSLTVARTGARASTASSALDLGRYCAAGSRHVCTRQTPRSQGVLRSFVSKAKGGLREGGCRGGRGRVFA